MTTEARPVGVSDAEREAGTYAIGQLFVAVARMRERIEREKAAQAQAEADTGGTGGEA